MMKIATLLSAVLPNPNESPRQPESPEMVVGATSVVVLTYNSMKTIAACLKSVIPTLGPNDEVILVDNGSTDGTIQFLEQLSNAGPVIRVILNNANLGFSAGSNVGLKAAKGEFLVLLNPDTEVTTGWIEKMSRQFKHERVGAVGPVIDNVGSFQKLMLHVPDGLSGNYDYEGIARVLHDTNDGNGQLTTVLIGCCMMIRRQVLDEVGYLDPELFLGCDDLDISWRIMLANYRLVIARDVFVHHQCHASFDTEPKKKTDLLVQESWTKFARKLIAYYGMGQVPPPEILWGIDWFEPPADIWEGATLPFEPTETRKISPAIARTVGTFAAKIALNSEAATIIEIGDETKQLLPKVDAVHRVVKMQELKNSPELLNNAVVICDGLGLSFEDLYLLSDRAIAVVVAEEMSGPSIPDGLPVLFSGEMYTFRDRLDSRSKVWVLDRSKDLLSQEVPEDFRPVAVITTFNDIDVIERVIDHTIAQGLRVVIIDNWSTDGTYEKLLSRRKQLESLERFPPEGPSKTFDSYRILCRQEEIATRFPGEWITLQASDELRESPWKGVSFREGLYAADCAGATCVELAILEFRPVDNRFRAGSDPETTFEYCEFGKHESCLIQHKTWKQPEEKVQIAVTGGHAVFFEGKKLFPYKFLLRHYSIRSQAHGEKKVFGMRQNRWNQEEREKLGWHTHYDGMRQGHNFLKSPQDLLHFNPETFYDQYLVERVTTIGTVPKVDWWIPLPPSEWK